MMAAEVHRWYPAKVKAVIFASRVPGSEEAMQQLLQQRRVNDQLRRRLEEFTPFPVDRRQAFRRSKGRFPRRPRLTSARTLFGNMHKNVHHAKLPVFPTMFTQTLYQDVPWGLRAGRATTLEKKREH